MLKVLFTLIIFAVAMKGYIAYVGENPSFTDGQYVGYGLLIGMVGAMLVGWAWETRKR